MKSIMTKKALVIVAASLVIALVISIIPGGFLVSAAELSRAEAREIALEELKKENIIVDDEEVRVGRPTLDENDEFYTVTIKTKDNDYILKINATNKDGEVLEVVEKSVKTGKEVVLKDVDKDDKKDDEKEVAKEPGFDSFNEFYNKKNPTTSSDMVSLDEDDNDNKYLDEDDYTSHGEVKPTPEAELNEVLRDAKKAAITEFKDVENKVEAKEAFKDAKDVIKEVKKNTQEDIKEDKKSNEKPLVNNDKISEDEAMAIALKSIKVNINNKNQLEKVTNQEIDFDDDNPPAYEIKFEYEGKKYEFLIHAQTGKILDFVEEPLQIRENNKEKEKEKEENENKENNGNNNKNKNSNNGKGNK